MRRRKIYVGTMLVLLIPFISRTLIVRSSHLNGDDSRNSETGSFFLNNSEVTLIDEIWWYNIGTHWNLTVHIHPNSTSAVKITAFLDDGISLRQQKEPLSGNFTFQVSPNETCSEIYVSHTACDEIHFFYFNGSLTNVSGIASGTFHFQETHPGYNPYVDTDCVHAENITLWLETRRTDYYITSESSTTIQLHTSSFSLFTIIFTLFVIVFIKYRRRINRGKDSE
ncbi:MAG: hypothetical protein JSW11_15040 [Candidatus Heimdallarchaeota archaeon]|nr:MAG: hypothetical protein JSW11_15040 [Candidatus Heimdallarchaeota archaeon]